MRLATDVAGGGSSWYSWSLPSCSLVLRQVSWSTAEAETLAESHHRPRKQSRQVFVRTTGFYQARPSWSGSPPEDFTWEIRSRVLTALLPRSMLLPPAWSPSGVGCISFGEVIPMSPRQTAGLALPYSTFGSGRVRSLGAGINLTTTTDGRDLLVALDPSHLVKLSPTGARLSPVWTVPSGYTLNTYASQHPLAAVAGGIAVESTRPIADFGCVCSGDLVSEQRHRPRPRTRRFCDRLLHTAGANHSLLAWIDGSGAGADVNRLAITDTATMATRLISSPLSGSVLVSSLAVWIGCRRVRKQLLGRGSILPRRPTARRVCFGISTS